MFSSEIDGHIFYVVFAVYRVQLEYFPIPKM